MDVQGTVSPGEAQRKSNIRKSLILVVGVVVFWCLAIFLGLKFTEALHLSTGCSQVTFASATYEQCNAWSRKVWLASPRDYNECMELRPEDSEIFDEVYQCLEDRGLGVNDIE
jgi:hypothetical protein